MSSSIRGSSHTGKLNYGTCKILFTRESFEEKNQP